MAQPSPIEQALVAHLGGVLGVPVSTMVPAQRPERFVIVSRTGGPRLNLAQSRPTVLVECWATRTADAWSLVVAAYDAMDSLADRDDALPKGAWVADVDLAEPVNYPDAASGSPRYQFLATLTVNLDTRER